VIRRALKFDSNFNKISYDAIKITWSFPFQATS